MPLDPQAQRLLDAARNAGLPPITQVSVHDARIRMAKALTYTGELEAVARVEDLVISVGGRELRVRYYNPHAERTLPAVIYFHGGGWVLNSVTTHDHLCRALANRSECIIIAPDYRLAPEFPFPAAIEDAWGVTQWTFENASSLGIDPLSIGVAGDSSGGTQAAVVAQLARDAGGPNLKCQVLIYPVLDHWGSGADSYREMGTGYSLSRELMIWFWNHYAGPAPNLEDPRLCPLRATDFKGLPPTLVITAEFDPLRDEGEEYVRKLLASNVAARARRYDGMMHGFVIQFRALDKGLLGLTEAANFLRKHLRAEQ